MRRSILPALALLLLSALPSHALSLPTREQVLDRMRLANDYFMRKWPDPGTPMNVGQIWPSNIWTRGTYYEGLLAFHALEPDQRYYDYAVQWGEANHWGLHDGPLTRDADNQCCGQSYIDLYRIDSRPERIRDIRTAIDAIVASPTAADWSWIDAIHMGMPVYARLAVLYNDSRYLEKMHALFDYTKTRHGTNGLYNPVDHLWWRDADFDPPYREPNGEDCYWSRGNGWVFAALTRVLDVLPDGAPHRDEYETMFRDMAAALKEVQRDDGFWNVSLHDPTHFGGRETSGTAFFVYGMAWGIRKGVLDRDTYLSPAIRGWSALANNALHADGFLGYVQGTGKQPSDSQPVTYDRVPNFEDFALGAFLLAGSEVVRVIDGTPDVPPTDNPRVANLSTRGRVSPQQNLIGGFVVRGNGPQLVLVRAVGPTLRDFGVPGTLPNPHLRVYSEGTRAWENADWQSPSLALTVDSRQQVTASQEHTNVLSPAAAAAKVGAFGLTAASADAALVLRLDPGLYTAHVSSADATGVALIEVYEIPETPASGSRLVNISSRCDVRSDADMMIAGFIIRGGPRKVLLRAVGPTLSGLGVDGSTVLTNPKLVLYKGARQVLAENDDWGTVLLPTAQLTARHAAGAFDLPQGSRDAEITATLAEGDYTVQVSGVNGATGIALVEVYELP